MSTPIRGSAWPPRSPAIGAPSAPTRAGHLRGSRPGRSHRAGRLQPGLVPPGAVSAHGGEQARARRRIVVIDPRRTATADNADLFLAIAPGIDTALFSGLLVDLADSGALDFAFIDAHTTGFRRAFARAPRDRAGSPPRPRRRPGLRSTTSRPSSTGSAPRRASSRAFRRA